MIGGEQSDMEVLDGEQLLLAEEPPQYGPEPTLYTNITYFTQKSNNLVLNEADRG